MLVSAVVSTYNAQKFIRGRLENLVTQTLYQKGQLEIIVIDSGSQEDEASVVREFSARYKNIRYLRTKERETVYGSWNRGIAMAQGRYFINANSDDRFAEDALERLTEVLDDRSEFAAAYGNWYYTDIENDNIDSSNSKKLYEYPEFYPPLLFYHQITSHALMIRCHVFSEIGIFNDSMEVFGDRDWILRFAIAGLKAIRIKHWVGLYLKRDDSLERAKRNIGNEEFNNLLHHYQQPERFVRLHGYQKSSEKPELAQLYALTGALGIHFFKTDSEGCARLPQQSLLFFRRALALDPDNFMAGNNLAVVAALQGGTEFAVEKLSYLLALYPDKKSGYLERNLKMAGNRSQNISDFCWCFNRSVRSLFKARSNNKNFLPSGKPFS